MRELPGWPSSLGSLLSLLFVTRCVDFGRAIREGTEAEATLKNWFEEVCHEDDMGGGSF